MKRTHWLALAGFASLVLFLRLPTFHRSVLDWDESTFLLIARGLLRGQNPYDVSWEHGPHGISVLFAIGQMLFGQSVVAIRLLTWLAVTLECFLLYRLGDLLGRTGSGAGVIAGLLYAVLSLTNQGLPAHRELFWAPLATLALILLLTAGPAAALPSRRANVLWLLAGLLLGFGLQLKYLYIFDVAAIVIIGLLTLASGWSAGLGKLITRTWLLALLLIAGGLAAWLIEASYLFRTRDVAEYIFGHFTASAAYSSSGALSLDALKIRLVLQITTSPLLWLSLALTPIYLLVVKPVDRRERRHMAYMALWFGLALLDTIFTKRLWEHYFLVLLPPLCLLTALLVTGLLRPDAGMDRRRRVLALILLLGAPLVPVALPAAAASAGLVYRHYVRGLPMPPDAPAEVAAYLREHVPASEPIYIADYEPIVYFLADRKAPTRYAFPPRLIDQQFAKVDRIDPLAELAAIMTRQPSYLVRVAPPSPDMTNPAFAAALDRYVQERYILEKAIPALDTFTEQPISVQIYRLKDGS